MAFFFLQPFALVTPLFFQVVMDRRRCTGALTVVGVRLLTVSFFEALLSGLRAYVVLPPRGPRRPGAGHAAVSPSPCAAASRLRDAPGRGCGGPSTSARARPAILDRFGAHRAARPRLLGGAHCSDALLVGIAHSRRARVASLLDPPCAADRPAVLGATQRQVQARRRRPGFSGGIRLRHPHTERDGDRVTPPQIS